MTISEIKEAFGGRMVGDQTMKNSVARAILLLPHDLQKSVIDKVWFFSSDKESFGYAFNGNDLKNEHLIFLSDFLFDEKEHQIMYTILHEIGHIALGHKNSIQYTQSYAEIKKQEDEADEFARRYLQ